MIQATTTLTRAGLEVMLRMYLAQQCLGLSDEGIEDALYTSARAANPRRWSGTTRDWTPRGAVTLNPERDAAINAAIVSQDKQARTA